MIFAIVEMAAVVDVGNGWLFEDDQIIHLKAILFNHDHVWLCINQLDSLHLPFSNLRDRHKLCLQSQ